jgi:hypothetical protein
VDESAIGLLEGQRPLIKQRWEALLRVEPVVSPLSSPDALVYLMDETLDQLVAAMRTRSVKSWLRRHQALVAPLGEQCVCGLNPLLSYYITGRIALTAVTESKLGPAFADVLLFFHSIAQKDLEALCGVCCNQGSATCPQRALALEAARHATLLRS